MAAKKTTKAKARTVTVAALQTSYGSDMAANIKKTEKLVRDAAKKGATPVTRSQIAALVEYCSAQQEDVESPLDDDELDSERFAAVDGRPLDEDNPAGQIDREDVPLLVDHRDGRRRAEVEHDHRQRILLRRRGVRGQNIGAERLRLFDGERQTDR